MTIFKIVMTTVTILTLVFTCLIPYVQKQRMKSIGIDKDYSYFNRRVMEHFGRYTNSFFNPYYKENAQGAGFMLIPVQAFLLMGAFVSQSYTPLFFVPIPFLIFILPFTIPHLLPGNKKSYLFVDEDALETIIDMKSVSWDTSTKMDDAFYDELLNRNVINLDFAKELNELSDIALDFRKVSYAIETAISNRKDALLDAEGKKLLDELIKQNEERKSKLFTQLHESDKVFLYSIGVIEEPGILRLSKEMDVKESEASVSEVQETKHVPPAIEALMKLAQDKDAEEWLRKYAMDTIREIHEKTAEEASNYQSELKKDDAISTIVAARKMHHLKDLPLDKKE